MSAPNQGPPFAHRSPLNFKSEKEKPKNYMRFGNDKESKYMKKVSLWARYPRAVSVIVSLTMFCTVFSKPIYCFFRDPSTVKYEETLWPRELITGKTNVERLREKILKVRAIREEKRAKREAMAAQRSS